MAQNDAFSTKVALDQLIAVAHKCCKPTCSFSNPDNKILWEHIGTHVKFFRNLYVCTIGNESFSDELWLCLHNQLAHYLQCTVCGDQS